MKQSYVFSGIPLLFLLSKGYWQLDIWFLYLSKSRLYIRRFSVHILLNPSLKDFEHYLASMWNQYNCMAIWTFFDIAILWDWNKNWPFSNSVAIAKFSKCAGIATVWICPLEIRESIGGWSLFPMKRKQELKKAFVPGSATQCPASFHVISEEK